MKISLRKFTTKDVYKLTNIVKQDLAESAYLEWPFTKEVALRFISNYNTWGIWINGGILAGAVEVKETLETAYFVAPQWQNKGVATQALELCQAHFGTRQLWCLINPNNKPSLRVAEKAKLRIQFYR